MPQLKYFSSYAKNGNLVWAHRSSHGQHNRFEEHSHDFIELVYIVQGRGRHQINGSSYDIRTGDVYLIMPGECHHFPDAAEFNVEIVNCLFRRETIRAYLPPEPGSFQELPYVSPFYWSGECLPRKLSLDAAESTEVLGMLEDIILEVKGAGPGAGCAAVYMLMKLLIGLSRLALKEKHPPELLKPRSIGHEILVRRVRGHMESCFYQKITVDDLARYFTVSSRHLNRIFREQTGQTIIQALQAIRIERAKHMLSETNQSVDSIASAVGFGDPSHFHRIFLRLVGRTPSSFRKQAVKKRISRWSGIVETSGKRQNRVD